MQLNTLILLVKLVCHHSVIVTPSAHSFLSLILCLFIGLWLLIFNFILFVYTFYSETLCRIKHKQNKLKITIFFIAIRASVLYCLITLSRMYINVLLVLLFRINDNDCKLAMNTFIYLVLSAIHLCLLYMWCKPKICKTNCKTKQKHFYLVSLDSLLNLSA